MRPDVVRRGRAETASRRGAVLIIVIGLSTVLLALVVAFLAQMRSDAAETRGVVASAQARAMLHAALMYVQESSRVGWGDAGGECFGWTDVRDGSLGPRGARPAGAAGAATAIPAPDWWRSTWPSYKPSPNEDTDFPPMADRRGGWPLPGTAVRCPMAVPEVAPYATQLRFNYNPVEPPIAYSDPSWETSWMSAGPGWDPIVSWPKPWIDRIYDPAAGSKSMLDPQPVKGTWGEFCQGEVDPSGSVGDWTHDRFDAAGDPIPGARTALKVVPGSENLSWFRIYRETQKDHDDIDNVGKPGTLWWDRVALYDASPTAPLPKIRNWNAFIITCGAGGTRGYRFWNQAEIDDWESAHGLPSGTGRCLEPVTAEESGIFTDADSFHDLLTSSTVLWFRVEWSALQSGARNASVYNKWYWTSGLYFLQHDGMFYNNLDVKGNAWNPMVPGVFVNCQYATTVADESPDDNQSDTRSQSPKTYGGNFKWLQRLDRDPVLW